MAAAAVPINRDDSRPTDVADVARRQRRTIAAFHLAIASVIHDLGTLQGYVQTLASGFDLTAEQRHELSQIALRLLDAQEVLER